ncbi:MAG: hypothetical protein UW03_C0040G0001, partial [Candidatus Peregrinibacteria bacterium GW2011_GWA2_43_8]
VVPQIGQYVSELKIGEKFLQHVMAPIAIGLAMSVGYLMTSQVKSSGSGGIEVGGLGNLKMCDLTSGDATGALLSTNISDIQQLMIASIAVAVVWLGVFGAADKTIANSITNGIKDAGTRAVKFTASLLKYVPIVPVMTRGKEAEQFSFADISGMLNKVYALPEMLSSKKVGTYAAEWMPKFYGDQSAGFDNLMTKFNSGTTPEKGEIVKQWIQGGLSDDQQANKAIEALKAAGVKELDGIGGLHQFEAWYKTHKKNVQDAFPGVSFEDVEFAKGTADATTEPESGTSTDRARAGDAAAATGGTAVTVDKVIASGGTTYQQGADISGLRGKMFQKDGTTMLTDEQIKIVLGKKPLQTEFADMGGGKVKVTNSTLYTTPATPAPALAPGATPPAEPPVTPNS